MENSCGSASVFLLFLQNPSVMMLWTWIPEAFKGCHDKITYIKYTCFANIQHHKTSIICIFVVLANCCIIKRSKWWAYVKIITYYVTFLTKFENHHEQRHNVQAARYNLIVFQITGFFWAVWLCGYILCKNRLHHISNFMQRSSQVCMRDCTLLLTLHACNPPVWEKRRD